MNETSRELSLMSDEIFCLLLQFSSQFGKSWFAGFAGEFRIVYKAVFIANLAMLGGDYIETPFFSVHEIKVLVDTAMDVGD